MCLHLICSLLVSVASAHDHTFRLRIQVHPREKIAGSASLASHPVELRSDMGIFSNCVSRLIQLLNKWSPHSQGGSLKPPQLDDQDIPHQFDFPRATESVSVHLVFRHRARKDGKQHSFKKILQVVCTHLHRASASYLL